MPSNQIATTNEETGSGIDSKRLTKALAAGGVAFAAHLMLNFGGVAIIVIAMVTIGAYLIAEPSNAKALDRPQQPTQLPSGQPAQAFAQLVPANQPPQTKLDTSKLWYSATQTRQLLVPKVSSPLVSNKAKSVLQVGDWLIQNFDALVDHPDHQATVSGVLNRYLPQTLDHYIGVQQSDSNQIRQTTIDALSLLEEELFRIKKAIVDQRVEDLTGHAEALKRRFRNPSN